METFFAPTGKMVIPYAANLKLTPGESGGLPLKRQLSRFGILTFAVNTLRPTEHIISSNEITIMASDLLFGCFIAVGFEGTPVGTSSRDRYIVLFKVQSDWFLTGVYMAAVKLVILNFLHSFRFAICSEIKRGLDEVSKRFV
ncbi:MAG: hypothetical protein HWE26_02630 [Alteromonadaceae bacterium]|nr:hypothetical protein [Alteromonadaceae bacterium]